MFRTTCLPQVNQSIWLDPISLHHGECALDAFLDVEGAFYNVEAATIEKALVGVMLKPPLRAG